MYKVPGEFTKESVSIYSVELSSCIYVYMYIYIYICVYVVMIILIIII